MHNEFLGCAGKSKGTYWYTEPSAWRTIGEKGGKGKESRWERFPPHPLYSSRFYPLPWLWGVLCKKDLGPIRKTSKCQMEMICVLLLRLFYIRRSFMGINQKKREIKHLFFDLGGWSFNMKSLCCSSFSFSVPSLPITQCLLMWKPGFKILTRMLKNMCIKFRVEGEISQQNSNFNRSS